MIAARRDHSRTGRDHRRTGRDHSREPSTARLGVRFTTVLATSTAMVATVLGAAGCGPTGGPAGSSVWSPAPSTGSSAPAGAPGNTAVPGPSGAPGQPGATASGPGVPGPGGSGPGTAPGSFVFPVSGKVSYARVHHDYPATDIMAPCGSQVRAVTNGVILETEPVDRYNPKVNDGATRGGLSVSLLGDDGVRYYGSHFRSIAAGVTAGTRVRAGQELGVVGDTGDASACHLHFGISPVCGRTGDWWVRRGAIWPWRYLDVWRAGGTMSAAVEVAAWQTVHGCPPSAPPGA